MPGPSHAAAPSPQPPAQTPAHTQVLSGHARAGAALDVAALMVDFTFDFILAAMLGKDYRTLQARSPPRCARFLLGPRPGKPAGVWQPAAGSHAARRPALLRPSESHLSIVAEGGREGGGG